MDCLIVVVGDSAPPLKPDIYCYACEQVLYMIQNQVQFTNANERGEICAHIFLPSLCFRVQENLWLRDLGCQVYRYASSSCMQPGNKQNISKLFICLFNMQQFLGFSPEGNFPPFNLKEKPQVFYRRRQYELLGRILRRQVELAKVQQVPYSTYVASWALRTDKILSLRQSISKA